ncbi:MAG: esterase/lipase family protein [Pseudoxanthomonas sp.]
MKTPPRNADDLRGLGRLVIDGVTGVTDLVEAMHAAVTHLPAIIGKPAPVATTGLTGLVYRSVRGMTRLVGAGVENTLSGLAPLLGGSAISPQREAVLAAMNGVIGDHLQASGNPLAIPMQFRRHGQPLPRQRKSLAGRYPDATGKLLVMVHGLCMNDLQWNYAHHDHGEALHADLGYSPAYLHYNTGLHISSNGQEFSEALEALVQAWPVPPEEVVLLCHSMGGLVARSALDNAFANALTWSKLPIRIVFLGTPHHGAPLERAGSWVDMLIGISPYSAPFVRLGKIRSAGIQDLRHGNLRDADWQDRDGDGLADGRTPMPLPKQVQAYAMAASTQDERKDGGIDSLRGDGLVPIASALGQHKNRDFDLRIPKTRQWVGYGLNHLEMLGSEAVYQRIARWLKAPPTDRRRSQSKP